MKIKAVRDPANRGYASAAAVMKPWRVYIGRRCLVDARGRPRRFSTERAAIAAATAADADEPTGCPAFDIYLGG